MDTGRTFSAAGWQVRIQSNQFFRDNWGHFCLVFVRIGVLSQKGQKRKIANLYAAKARYCEFLRIALFGFESHPFRHIHFLGFSRIEGSKKGENRSSGRPRAQETFRLCGF